MKRILYLTFNDAPSGIFEGQVIDVCRYLGDTCHAEVKLCAFVSARKFSSTKEKIGSLFPGAIVKRMVPRARNWRWNRFVLNRVAKNFRPDVIIARGPFAANLALTLREKHMVSRVVFDARGAYVAELTEYNVVPDQKVKSEIALIEKNAVEQSDFRLAVSFELVKYWKQQYGYSGNDQVIIPCTLNNKTISAHEKRGNGVSRSAMGFEDEDVILVYSGSVAGWQSLHEMEIFRRLLREQKKVKLFFLSEIAPVIASLMQEFPNRAKRMWVKPEDVGSWLRECDYGWLVREKSVTNKVASPVKFAEYLAAGLPVIISEGLGDYSDLVKIENAGLVFTGAPLPELRRVTGEQKERMREIAMKMFTKERYSTHYAKVCGADEVAGA